MEYLLQGKTYTLHYRELKNHYERFCEMSDEEFLSNLPEAAHLACIICFLKETSAEDSIGDRGIIHQLIHFIAIPGESGIDLKSLRDLFKTTLNLA